MYIYSIHTLYTYICIHTTHTYTHSSRQAYLAHSWPPEDLYVMFSCQ